jgi:hypothetical protein
MAAALGVGRRSGLTAAPDKEPKDARAPPETIAEPRWARAESLSWEWTFGGVFALWILAIATNLAAIQRIYIVWAQHPAPQSSAAVPAEGADSGPQLPPAKPRRGAAPC